MGNEQGTEIGGDMEGDMVGSVTNNSMFNITLPENMFGDMFATPSGDDGAARPNPKQMALMSAVKSRETEIKAEMGKFFKCLREEMEEAFKKMDADGNGFLSKEEIKKVLEENSQKWGHVDDELFDKVDEDKDGKVSFEGKTNFQAGA